MSGNPFRASLAQKHPTAAPPTSFVNVDSSNDAEARDERGSESVLAAPSAPPAKTKKSVRIESPTGASPPHAAFDDADDALLQRVNSNRHVGSPPPVSPAGFSDNFEDIEANDTPRSGEMEAHGMARSTRRGTEAHQAVSSHGGAPANPFSRTLATMEPQEKGTREPTGHNRVDRTATERAAPASTKASLDVESFKNLLMTGISSPRSSGPPPQAATAPNPISASVFESSSTDTSSISRQSIFEPVQEPHPESPRTSYEMAGSDDDRASLVSDIRREKRKPPPAPKHRHGKLVTSRTPQIVSFSDFSATEPTTSPTPARNRTDSDLNKPLPPTPSIVSPPPHIISQDITQDPQSISDSNTSETASQSNATPAQKKAPPPVPIARRHSQLRSSTYGNRSRSNSSLTMSSQHSTEFPILNPGSNHELTSSPSQKAPPPPPPPTRRHGATLSTISTSSANSSSTELSSSATARRPTLSSPNPPSSRRTTFSSEPPSPSRGLQRSPSINSNRNNTRSVSNESSASAMPPPPPPPPRRRQSGRSGADRDGATLPPSSPPENRRTSTEYKRSSIDGKRRTSVASESSLKYEYAPAAESEPVLYSPKEENEESLTYTLDKPNPSGNNILDDMEKFQKEIEELREKYRHAA